MLNKELFMFVTGTVGGGIASCISSGINGNGNKLDFVDIVLNGIPVGAQLSSFPLSIHLLSSAFPKFHEIAKNKEKEPVKFYLFGGIFAALIYTSLNYPATILSYNRKINKENKSNNNNKNDSNKFKKITFNGFIDQFTDRLGISIGFPWAMNTLQNAVPNSKNTLIEWGRNHLLVCGSNITGRIFAFPIHKIKHGTNLSSMLIKYLKNTPNVMLTGDCVAAIKPAFTFMLN